MTTLTALADALTTSIQTRIADPAGWLVEARRLCEAAKLSTARCLPVPATLATIGFSIAQEAFAQGPAAVARVEAALAESDGAPNVATMIGALGVVDLRAALAEDRPISQPEREVLGTMRVIVWERQAALGFGDPGCELANRLVTEIRAEACKRLNLPNS